MKAFVKEFFDKTKDGSEVTRYTLENDNGIRVSVLDYGMRIQSLYVPDEDGDPVNVVWGYTSMPRYEGGGCYGALIGRFANRIKNASFTLDGTKYDLTMNDHGNYIHGNYEHTFFDIECEDDKITGKLISPDGEWGFPGTVMLKVTYALSEAGELTLTYEAVTDKATVINITNHSYFNLDGMPEDGEAAREMESINIFSHKMTIDADTYLEADEVNMVTGNVIDVTGNEFDFRTEKEIGRFKYDHNFCVNGFDGTLKKVATLKGAGSGIVMDVLTTQPGMQVYTGGRKAVAIETQHYPDAPNRPEWPGSVLRPGEIYKEETVFKFSLQ
ncbi:MAG: aldose epimerase family protein [Eubacteriales bacterium]|nr:aldose epimerase family protein [Eubacteriales bacterium]